ncbi:hypothetical protein PPSIR1_38414 [Plesiocystis pacifica SIR-1]|uniref:Uncharacterized protein n=1 Tax=Plesiocystis pacifica SIR-1 TaxID=391625 RepID=A6G8K6_9BACT|nr:hypothetical protein PPSIR1_38414 [Plesiocystis pacifica SIR-1]
MIELLVIRGLLSGTPRILVSGLILKSGGEGTRALVDYTRLLDTMKT